MNIPATIVHLRTRDSLWTCVHWSTHVHTCMHVGAWFTGVHGATIVRTGEQVCTVCTVHTHVTTRGHVCAVSTGGRSGYSSSMSCTVMVLVASIVGGMDAMMLNMALAMMSHMSCSHGIEGSYPSIWTVQ